MLNLLHFGIVIFSLFAIVLSCQFFTNAIEHLGKKLNLDNNVVGSILAVIGTTLPETIVPLVAVLGAILLNGDIFIGQQIALGAIIGSPFMLLTFGIFVLFFVLFKRKENALSLKIEDVIRNYKYLIFAYILAFLTSFVQIKIFKIFVAIFLIAIYLIFVLRTILKSTLVEENKQLDELLILKIFKTKNETSFFLISLQLIFSLVLLTLSSHYFVFEIKHFSSILNLNPIILSLVITPFATELPECVNSIIWAKDKKDDLAVANITGAVVFQTTVLFAIGMILTPWAFNYQIIMNMILVLINSFAVLFYCLFLKQISAKLMLFCGLFYLCYIILLFIK